MWKSIIKKGITGVRTRKRKRKRKRNGEMVRKSHTKNKEKTWGGIPVVLFVSMSRERDMTK